MVEQSGSSAEEPQSSTIRDVSAQKCSQTHKVSPKNPTKSKNHNNITNNDTISNRFSLFRWFKRPGIVETPSNNINESVCSSSESVNTFYSTATVKSFAFHSPEVLNQSNIPIALDLLDHNNTRVGPFGAGAAKIVEKKGKGSLDVTRTLPADVLSKNRNLTSRYSLQNCSQKFGSCNNINETDISNKKILTKRVHVRGKRRAPNPPVNEFRPRSFCAIEGIDDNPSLEAARTFGTRRKQRRPAPKPPVETVRVEEGMESSRIETKSVGNSKNVLQGQVWLHNNESANNKSKKPTGMIFKQDKKALAGDDNDTLVLQSGYLAPKKESTVPSVTELQVSSAIPKPWYKRSVFENSIKKTDNMRTGFQTRDEVSNVESSSSSSSKRVDDSFNSSSRLSFFRNTTDDKRKDSKRRSGLSILANISELDKEAAAIVQEEQAKTKALFLQQSWKVNENEKHQEVIQDIVTSAIESSPRRGTRALISKFNAIGNITKVTVNSNFFNKTPTSSARNIDKNKDDGNEKGKNVGKIEKKSFEPDLSKYFPQKSIPQSPRSIRSSISDSRRSFLQTTLNSSTKFDGVDQNVATESKRIINDVTNRLSILQTAVSKGSQQQKIDSPVLRRSSKPSADDKPRIYNYESSPKVYRTKDNSFSRNEMIAKEFNDIFEEVDKQLKLGDDKAAGGQADQKQKTHQELEAASKVSKVLDILVEAEKGLKNGEDKKSKTSLMNDRTDQITTDLKEMLKEMKHSLPKRPKPRKSIDSSSESSKLDQLNVVKITNPPVLQMGPSTSSEASTSSTQKVSSSVQTSGNVRRIAPSTSHQWKNDDVIYRTSGRSKSSGSGLVKNTFQLMRPREFAAIEAIKTLKHTEDNDNTYANVMTQSLYANALVFSSRNHRVISNESFESDGKNKTKLPTPQEDKIPVRSAEPCDNQKDTMATNMNTLAVNRLLKKLEASIASGNHQQAAEQAKELARLKIQCSVIRQKPTTGDLINLDMYIEDRLAHQGPIPLQLPLVTTVKQLKEKIFNEFEIPANVQRWIIGKTLANDDNATLDDLKAIEGSPVFLYLVAPDLQIVDTVKQVEPKVIVIDDDNDGDDDDEPVQVSSDDKKVDDDKNYPLPVIELIEDEKNVETTGIDDENINQHELIEQKKPNEDDNKTADGVVGSLNLTDTEQYLQLIMLENCEIVPNVHPIECPICFSIYGPLEGVVLRDCLHSFCRNCIENTIKHCDEAEVKCPYRDSEYSCQSTLQEREIKALVNPLIYEQHLAKSITQAENNAGNNAFHCKTPDCPNWCLYEDNVNNFLCSVCNKNNCLTCRVIHEGKNCFEYQNDVKISQETDEESKRTAAMLSEMLRRGEAMACPTCDVVLMKKMGCDWLRCSMCKTEICWVTKGPRWGPGGTGDTSGGCRCGLNGIKCHPCCHYCH
ncbi:serine-rich adhesin for platelets-like [Chelonus insularis]|uniref:serine-rich adhesin for platelets-like n=1 Tax=Chelonus insularis TaxID=460826 RepID=UPI00158D6CF1|nr:serine-rich adhesin for platelets-like [Chelonus insularis]